MGATNTPLYDLIELSGITANTTFDTAPGGGGDILGVVDNATYTDGDGSNSATQIAELNETSGSNGTLTIDGVVYSIELVTPDGSGQNVTVTYNDGLSTKSLSGDGGDSQIVFIIASPTGGGATRYFALVDDTVGDLDGITAIQTRDLDWDPGGDDVKINADQNNSVAPVCYVQGTLIRTPKGERPVEALRVGDLVCTLTGGAQPIRWIGRRDMVFGPENAAHQPIRIAAGALGGGLPRRALMVSPQHRIVLGGPVPRALFGADRVLAVAKGLTGLAGVRPMTGKKRVTYVALLLDRHHILEAEGAQSESFLPGPTALDLLPERQRAEVLALFPALRMDPAGGYGPPAGRLLTRRESEGLAAAMQPARPRRLPGGRQDVQKHRTRRTERTASVPA
jgi:hypothetical protein